jgi:hypothetical protein
MNNATDLGMNSNPNPGLGQQAFGETEVHHTSSQQAVDDTNGEIAPRKNPLKGRSSPLSGKEARKIDRDMRTSSDVPVPDDPGHDTW